ncbi:MAG: hypothetical protein M3305_03005 [Actinomycetota bacterium]|nr:hypothetical protein [Actinomycetota bacterium]
MSDRPESRPENHRRRGPLGGEEDTGETTRRVPQGGSSMGESPGGEEPTRQALPEGAERGPASSEGASRETTTGEEDLERRIIRTTEESSGTREDERMLSSRDYQETSEGREERLREVYGGVDWLASFVGCIFAIVCSGVLLALLGLVLAPLGFTLNLEGREVNTLLILGLVVLGFVLFVAYFLGGYVAGRLVRFDGGRNGAATVLWGTLLSIILAIFGSLLPGPFSFIQDFMQYSVLPAISSLTETGLAGLAIIVGAILVEILGGFLGGRLGNGYHTRIDHTT